MPPSITVGGTESSKTTPVHSDVSHHILPSQAAVPNKDISTTNLSGDENDDLQKAIELSLQEQPEQTSIPLAGLTTEEQDVSKALEVSLQDSSPSATVDVVNPQNRKRESGIPVGLKNIGNSCWFNVVIQPLYFISLFRDLIINYPKDILEKESLSKSYAKQLIPALQHLFSLLIGSDRKYVDPTESLKLFQDQEMKKNTQQDVCEFIHKLLEKLEEEFNLLKIKNIEKESLGSDISEGSSGFENPIVKLFYGQFKKEMCESLTETKLETFGQYPLHVKEYKDIHESILASMIGEILEEDSCCKSSAKQSKQDLWFQTLPSVLIFSLSRFEYSKEKKRAEKVHNKFDFPEYLFMDRYMEANKDIVKEKHVKIKKIQQELKYLYAILEKYKKFGSGETKYPLVDILKYALEFAGNVVKCNESNPSGQSFMDVDVAELMEFDVDMSDSREMEREICEVTNQFPSLNEEKQKSSDSPKTELGTSQEKFVQISPNKKIRLVSPAPQTVYSGELSVLQACLPRWQKEVELQVDLLKKSIENLEGQLSQMFEEPSFHHIPYKLHAVVVHEGQASVGHYWVYIFDNFKNVWMKFNDIQVTESSWSELLQDSIGGQNNASAYCLMYIDQKRYDFLFANPNPDDLSSYLPINLQEYVKQDNLSFMTELEEWDAKQVHQSSPTNNDFESRMISVAASHSSDMFALNEEDIIFFFDIQTMLTQKLLKVLQNEETILQEKNKGQWLLSVVTNELKRLKALATQRIYDDGHSEPSLLDLTIYITRNCEKDLLLHWYAFEIVWYISQDKNSKAMLLIRQEAFKILQQFQEKHSASLGSCYQGWKKHYHNFVSCAWHFIYGYRKLKMSHYEVALMHMIHALKLHQEIKDNLPSGDAKNLDFRVLSYCHRKCLQTVNDKLADNFLTVETESEANEIVQVVDTLVVPGMWFLNNSKDAEDEVAENYIRHRWCQILDVPVNKSSLIKKIIEHITCVESVCFKFPLKMPSIPPVLSLYNEYKDSVASLLSVIKMLKTDKNDSQTSNL